MALTSAAPDLTVPDRGELTLTVKNVSGQLLEDVAVEWVSRAGVSVASTSAKVDATGESRIQAVATTAAGARWGLSPIVAVLRGKLGGVPRVFSTGVELVIAPRVRVEMDPMS